VHPEGAPELVVTAACAAPGRAGLAAADIDTVVTGGDRAAFAALWITGFEKYII
jgi:hypothetical protein